MSTIDIRKRAEHDAQRLLREYLGGSPGLSDMPIDATSIAEFYGAEVYWDDLDDEELDGFILIRGGEAEITINRNQALNRRRFTCAHELGHMVEHQGSKATIGFLDNEETLKSGAAYYRDGVSSGGTSKQEMYANAFAASLLMPSELVKSLHRSGASSRELAKYFRVSDQAMTIRLQTLGLGE